MMSEMFYKFFIVLKRMLPDIKFIIAGDFAQLLPVKDRVEDSGPVVSISTARILFSSCRAQWGHT